MSGFAFSRAAPAPRIERLNYRVHGLTLRVIGDLPLALADGADSPADITIHVGLRPDWHDEPLDRERILRQADVADADATVTDAGWIRGGDGLRIRYSEGATFWIAASLTDIWLAFEPPLTAVDAAHFLLEPVLAFVLRMRKTLVLHASGVEMDGAAVAFCGPPGAGKSTMAAACVAARGALLSDDVLAVEMREHGPTGWIAHRGTGTLRLWDDTVQAFLEDAGAVPTFSATWNKRVVDPHSLGGRAVAAHVPLALVCVLGGPTAGATTVEPLVGSAAFQHLVANTAASFLHDHARRAEELRQLSQLIAAVPVVRLASPRDYAHLDAVVEAVRMAMRVPRRA